MTMTLLEIMYSPGIDPGNRYDRASRACAKAADLLRCAAAAWQDGRIEDCDELATAAEDIIGRVNF